MRFFGLLPSLHLFPFPFCFREYLYTNVLSLCQCEAPITHRGVLQFLSRQPTDRFISPIYDKGDKKGTFNEAYLHLIICYMNK